MDLDQLVISPPLSLDPKPAGDGGGAASEKQRGFLARVIELFKSVRPGSDITKFQVPVQLNMPKSQLQVYGESVYCCGQDLLSACARGSNPLERFLRVVAWHISTTRLAPFAQAPFNPILGETHHVSCGNLNVLLEQVSHHPPITALYATNEVANLRLQWWQNACPRFYGNKVEVTIKGKRNLWLDLHKENYEMTCPKLLIRLFPAPGNEWVGSTIVKCSSSGLEAALIFKGKPFFGLTGTLGQITGQILDTDNNKVLYELSGGWNRVVTLKEVKTRETSVLFDAQTLLNNLKAPTVQNVKDLKEMESIVVWRAAMQGLVRREWEAARKAKHELEERQRALAKKRKKDGNPWTPKHFELDGDNWQWCHTNQLVCQAPLVVSLDP